MSTGAIYIGRRKTCSNPGCGRVEEKEGTYKRCSQCQQTFYCSKDCQSAHWGAEHKRVCKALAQGASPDGLVEVVVMPCKQGLREQPHWIPGTAEEGNRRALAKLVGCEQQDLTMARPERGDPKAIYDLLLFFDSKGFEKGKEVNLRASIILTPLDEEDGVWFYAEGPRVKARGDVAIARVPSRLQRQADGSTRVEMLVPGLGRSLLNFTRQEFNARWGNMSVFDIPGANIPGKEHQKMGTVMPRDKEGNAGMATIGMMLANRGIVLGGEEEEGGAGAGAGTGAGGGGRGGGRPQRGPRK